MKFFFLALSLTLFYTVGANAWDRRGHSIVNTTAAYLVSDDAKVPAFFREHSFDLAYYANIPDNLWKVPATYAAERGEHYSDLDVIEAAFKKEGKGAGLGLKDDPFNLSRKDFEKRFPAVTRDDGRSFWRIRELNTALVETQAKLKAVTPTSPLSQPAVFNLQAKWLLFAGLIGHYVGDLGQPLHVTENFDGQATRQPGIHAYFEGPLVDELFPQLEVSALDRARGAQKDFRKKHESETVVQLLEWLARDSEKQLPELLVLDKKLGRTNVEKSAKANRDLIVRQMSQSALVLAEIWRRAAVGWTPDNERFWVFLHKPAYIEPGTSTSDIRNEEFLNEFGHR